VAASAPQAGSASIAPVVTLAMQPSASSTAANAQIVAASAPQAGSASLAPVVTLAMQPSVSFSRSATSALTTLGSVTQAPSQILQGVTAASSGVFGAAPPIEAVAMETVPGSVLPATKPGDSLSPSALSPATETKDASAAVLQAPAVAPASAASFKVPEAGDERLPVGAGPSTAFANTPGSAATAAASSAHAAASSGASAVPNLQTFALSVSQGWGFPVEATNTAPPVAEAKNVVPAETAKSTGTLALARAVETAVAQSETLAKPKNYSRDEHLGSGAVTGGLSKAEGHHAKSGSAEHEKSFAEDGSKSLLLTSSNGSDASEHGSKPLFSSLAEVSLSSVPRSKQGDHNAALVADATASAPANPLLEAAIKQAVAIMPAYTHTKTDAVRATNATALGNKSLAQEMSSQVPVASPATVVAAPAPAAVVASPATVVASPATATAAGLTPTVATPTVAQNTVAAAPAAAATTVAGAAAPATLGTAATALTPTVATPTVAQHTVAAAPATAAATTVAGHAPATLGATAAAPAAATTVGGYAPATLGTAAATPAAAAAAALPGATALGASASQAVAAAAAAAATTAAPTTAAPTTAAPTTVAAEGEEGDGEGEEGNSTEGSIVDALTGTTEMTDTQMYIIIGGGAGFLLVCGGGLYFLCGKK